jgi:hypothetical protein
MSDTHLATKIIPADWQLCAAPLGGAVVAVEYRCVKNAMTHTRSNA